jgi:hypothetical protein
MHPLLHTPAKQLTGAGLKKLTLVKGFNGCPTAERRGIPAWRRVP